MASSLARRFVRKSFLYSPFSQFSYLNRTKDPKILTPISSIINCNCNSNYNSTASSRSFSCKNSSNNNEEEGDTDGYFFDTMSRALFFYELSTGRYVSANHQEFIKKLPVTRSEEATEMQSKLLESFFQEDFRKGIESRSKFVNTFTRKLAKTRSEESRKSAEILSKSMGVSSAKLAAFGFVHIGLLWLGSFPEFGTLFYLLASRISFSAFWEDRARKRVQSLAKNHAAAGGIQALFLQLLDELKESDGRWFRLKLSYVFILVIYMLFSDSN